LKLYLGIKLLPNFQLKSSKKISVTVVLKRQTMKKLFLWVLMAGSNFWANAQVQVVVTWYYEEWGITQDSLNYKYNAGTNQLQYITDNVATNVSATDIDNQNPNNYIYDKSGNMVADNSQSMSVSWSPYGKILQNNKAGGANLTFGYNAMQQRVLKRVVLAGDTTRTYYIRDAQGNTMGIYKRHNDSVTWREQYIFGSSRLGLYRADTLVNKGLQVISKLYEGKRNYELTNHLGNVMAVINDRKADTTIGVNKGYNAVVISATDYFPFGMAIDSRNFSLKTYRYGFNDKETDSETGYQDYGMRMYDGKVPHFLSVDPLTKKYPQYSPYIFAGDNPIMAIDLDGAEPLQKVKDNQYETPDILANYGDYHKTGHNYFAIKASADMYWYIRVSATATTYGDKTFEYWDNKSNNYIPYIPTGYIDQKENFKNTCKGTGVIGVHMEGAVYSSLAIGGGVAYASATGTSLLASSGASLGVRATSSLADASVQAYFSDKKSFTGKIKDINWLSSVSQFVFTNPFTSSLVGNSLDLSIDKLSNKDPLQTMFNTSILGDKPIKVGASMLYGGIGNSYSNIGVGAFASKFGIKETSGIGLKAGEAGMNLFYNLNTNFHGTTVTNATEKSSISTKEK
jgi:RHS repeat-associated protein